MSFLTERDYRMTIQHTDLWEIIKDDQHLLIDATQQAVDEMAKFLRPKYDVNKIFADTLPFVAGETYTARQLYYMDAPPWIAQSYTIGQQVAYGINGVWSVYQCTVNASSTDLPTNTSFWVLLGHQHAYWYIDYPYPLFDIKRVYHQNTRVFWKDNIFQSVRFSDTVGQEDAIQYPYTDDIPLPNIFPDPDYANNQWGQGTPYSVTRVNPLDTASAYNPGTGYTPGQIALVGSTMWQDLIANGPPTPVTPGSDIITWQPVKWIKGDCRSKNLVLNVVNIAVYHLHDMVTPENIPAIRERNYERALQWCEEVMKGDFMFNEYELPKSQPPRGGRIIMGSRPKTENYY